MGDSCIVFDFARIHCISIVRSESGVVQMRWNNNESRLAPREDIQRSETAFSEFTGDNLSRRDEGVVDVDLS